MTVLQLGPMAVRTHPRTVAVGTLLAVAATGLGLAALVVGPAPVSIAQALRASVGAAVDDQVAFIVNGVRAPRMLTTALAGASFGLSGALMQSLTRNPLASPDFIGISAGAGAGAVAVIATTGGTSAWLTAGGAAGGALLAATVIVALSWRGGIVGLRMILAGIGIGFVATAGTQYVLTVVDVSLADRTITWLVGSTNARTWTHVAVAATALSLLAPVAVAFGRSLRTMELGDDLGRALGIHVTRDRLVLATCSVLLAAAATAVVGPVGFVALVSPAVARRLCRSPGVTILPSMLTGAALALAADAAAQHATGDLQLPIGIWTAAVGAPYLLWLVRRSAWEVSS